MSDVSILCGVAREAVDVRAGYQARLENEFNYHYHTQGGENGDAVWWNEASRYVISETVVSDFKRTAEDVHKLMIEGVKSIINGREYGLYGIPVWAIKAIEWSFNQYISGKGELPFYGRFDMSWNGSVNVLEYNATTPTALIEAAALQNDWAGEDNKQWNGISDAMIARWKHLKKLTMKASDDGEYYLHMLGCDADEDIRTLEYIGELAAEAGIYTKIVLVDNLQYDSVSKCFLDQDGFKIDNMFNLYPPEWMILDDAESGWGQHLCDAIIGGRIVMVEPIWKVLLSKGIWAKLWDMYPHYPGLLETHYDRSKLYCSKAVEKPLWGRQSDNVKVVQLDQGKVQVLKKDAMAFTGAEGYIYQEYTTLLNNDGHNAVFGVWMVGDEAVGLGIIEDNNEITSLNCQFVPHVVL